MSELALPFPDALHALPPEWPDPGLRDAIRSRLRASGTAVVVIDDDPTGTQTVHSVPVLTTWDEDTLRAELDRGGEALYVLTNSRALARPDAASLSLALGRSLAIAAQLSGRALAVVSRSDSTLRGHYPAETDALAEGLALHPDGVVIAPFFREGGRYTIDNVHYVLEGERLVPAANTEFAHDRAFGYSHSDLRRWVAEKTGNAWRPSEVASLSMDVIRRGGPGAVADTLAGIRGGCPVIVNAASDRDLEVVVAGMTMAEAAGRRFLCRTAASFAKVRAGISDRPLLGAADLPAAPCGSGGLVVVGSYVPRSSRQLEALLASGRWQPLELAVSAVLDPAQRDRILDLARRDLQSSLAAGRNVALYTSRQLVSGRGAEQSLEIGRSVSRALVSLVSSLPRAPRFLIAKGGVTSSDLATEGLGVRRAVVLGQLAPGVPVWLLGAESRFPGLAYVVFPGNVGSDNTLGEVAATFAGGT